MQAAQDWGVGHWARLRKLKLQGALNALSLLDMRKFREEMGDLMRNLETRPSALGSDVLIAADLNG